MTLQEALDIFTEMSERGQWTIDLISLQISTKGTRCSQDRSGVYQNVMKIDLLLQCWEEVDDGQEHT